jgi:hypothetical protein
MDAARVLGGWIDVVSGGGALVGVPGSLDATVVADATVEVDVRSTLVSDTVAVRIDDGPSDPATAPRAASTTSAVTA